MGATTTKRRRVKVNESAPTITIGMADQAAETARPVMRDEQECFVVLCLNIRNVLIGAPFVASIGTAYSVEVHPRDVWREAVKRNAAGVIVLHNHPSGDATPSADDLLLTKRLRSVGDLLGIPCVDHIVVTAMSHQSISEWELSHGAV